MFDKFAKTTNCLFIQALSPVSRYIVVQESPERPKLLAAGRLEHHDAETVVQHVRQELANKRTSVQRVVLLLPRGEVEVNLLELPPSSEDELPELVGNLLAQQVDDTGDELTNDFLVTGDQETLTGEVGTEETSTAAAHEVVTFSVPQSKINTWSQRFKEHKLQLQAVTFGGMGAVHLLSHVSNNPARTSIVVTTTDQDTDLAVVENGQPVLFRTIPRATGGEQFVSEQLADEIQRTLTLVRQSEDEQTRVYLIGTMDEQRDAATLLSDKLSLAVSLVNPFDQLRGDAHVDHPSRFANLIGTACAWNQSSLAIDLLNPRKPPPKPSPWGRVGFWGIVATLLLTLAGYLLWEQGEEQRAEISEKQLRFDGLVKRAKKAQSRVKVAEAIDRWRSSEVSWLDELDFLSSRLPREATIGSLSMSAPSQPQQRGRMSMSVEVNDPSVRLAMETAIRDDRHTPSSKRVTDTSNRANSAWRFETTVTVAPSPLVKLSGLSPPSDDTPKESESQETFVAGSEVNDVQ